MNVQDVKDFAGAWVEDLSSQEVDRLVDVGTVLESLIDDRDELFTAFTSAVKIACSQSTTMAYAQNSTGSAMDEYNRGMRILNSARNELVGAVLWEASESGRSLDDVAKDHGLSSLLSKDTVLGSLTKTHWDHVN